MKKGKKVFDEATRIDAIKRMQGGEKAAVIAQELGTGAAAIHQWNHHYKKFGSTLKTAKSEPTENSRVYDAILYLRNARNAIMKGVQNGKQLSEADLLVMLALKTLEGK